MSFLVIIDIIFITSTLVFDVSPALYEKILFFDEPVHEGELA